MVDAKTNRVPPFEESQAILAVPIVWLIPHPIVPEYQFRIGIFSCGQLESLPNKICSPSQNVTM